MRLLRSTRRTLRASAQVGAVALVVALLGLLVWDVAHGDGGKVAKKVDAGKAVQAPAIRLPRVGGGTFDLASLRGKVVVVNFWASWCLGCKEEARDLAAAAKHWKSKGVEFVGVNVQDFRRAAAGFVDRYDVGYTIVRDGAGSTLGHWGVTGLPETFFVDRRGRVVPPHLLAAASRAQIEEGVRRALRS
jgi:cytochrome c biogenesis protein CcmG, thiol:disulfide interchange protein DsbE